jgi:hypothetical protein
MTIVVEDGTGKADAESYISVTDADTYHSNLGNTDWTGTTAVKEAALRKATNYLQQQFGTLWAGYRNTSTQALDWPRSYVPLTDLLVEEYFANDDVPTEIVNACASLALRALTEDLFTDESRRVRMEKVDTLAVEYEPGASPQKRYVEIERMLARYLLGADGAIPVIRV